MRNLFLSLALIISSVSFASSPSDTNVFVGLAKKVVPSVVNISTFSSVKPGGSRGMGSPEDMFRKFFEDYLHQRGGMGGGEDEGQEQEMPDESPKGKSGPRSMSLGTGFIIEPGLILTNNHVVADAEEIKINFTESEEEKASDGEVVGRDTELDVALIRVKSKREMKPVVLGDSDALEVGEYVAAVGNPFGQGHSVTHGIISAKGRLAPDFKLAKYIQTDAPINPGNSGGPLVNLKGEVIGINNAIDQRAQGIGFAIPINLVKQILPQLKTKGSVSRGYIGVLVGELSPELAPKFKVKEDLKAPFVTHVYPGEPADKAGLKAYDVILEFNGKAIHSSDDLVLAVVSVPVGDSVPIKVSRAGKEVTVKITVAKRPGTPGAPAVEKSSKKKSKQKSHPELGMSLEDLTPETQRELSLSEKSRGVVVTDVAYGGPADQAGLVRGDLIIEVDQEPVKDMDGFYSKINKSKSYLLRVRRLDPQGKEGFMVIVLSLK